MKTLHDGPYSAESQDSQEHDESMITPRLRLERLQLLRSGYRPYFTCVVTLVQFFMIIWMCWTAGFTTIGLSLIVHQRIENNTLRGNIVVTYTERPSPLIGPSRAQLPSLGALFPPCMREDHTLNFHLARALHPGLETGGGRLGCCEAPESNVAGTTTKVECGVFSDDHAQWKETQCSQRSSGQSSVQHILRPCCGELNGQCTLTSPQHCFFLRGSFHLDAEHCMQVDCLHQLCMLGKDDEVDQQVTSQFSPRQRRQWWRLLTSLYVPQGILDGLLMICLQIWLSWGQENSFGWLRVSLVYHTAGVGGHLIGSLFTKYDSPQSGAGPAVGGLIGLALVEHVVVWPALKNPRRRLVRLIICSFVLLAVGTLPQVNNFSLITGFLYGCLFSLMFLSHLMMKSDKARVFRFLLVCVVATSFLISVVVFYGVQYIDISLILSYFNCVPYVEGLCT